RFRPTPVKSRPSSCVAWCEIHRLTPAVTGGDGVGPGAGSPNPSLYRSLPPDCPTVVVVRADHAAAAPGREGARSVAPRQRVRPLLLEAVFHEPLELGGVSDAAQSLAVNRRETPLYGLLVAVAREETTAT